MRNSYVKPERIHLKNHPDLNEKWVQDIIANDPSILGLGDLILRDYERVQPRAGKLDLLLRDVDAQRRYEVELQLGAADETHIIRTIEYWDIERKRYPQYDHCAVLIAEDITSRFLNVISLFNGTIPLIAIQMQALKIEDKVTLVFTTVLDEMTRGLTDEDEDAAAAPADRAYWEAKSDAKILLLADQILEILREFDPTLNLKYNKIYIGIEKDGQANNFVAFKPKKSVLNFEVKIPQSEETDNLIEKAGIDTLDYDNRYKQYRLRLTEEEIRENPSILRDLAYQAYARRTAD